MVIKTGACRAEAKIKHSFKILRILTTQQGIQHSFKILRILTTQQGIQHSFKILRILITSENLTKYNKGTPQNTI